MLWLPPTNRGCATSAVTPVVNKVERVTSGLPEAVRAEGVPARKLDWIRPLAQADAALVAAISSVRPRRGPSIGHRRRRKMLARTEGGVEAATRLWASELLSVDRIELMP